VKPLADCRLYTFVDVAYLRGRDAVQVARQLCDGGADLLQLRAKELTPAEIEALALKLRPITRDAGVWFVVNDHLDIAARSNADICHLGQEDFFEAGCRKVDTLRAPFPRLKIGLSSHAPIEAQRAVESGADYVAIGPVYATGTKPAAKPTTLDYVRWAAANVCIPWFAIGGIHLANLDDVLEAGATRVCVVSALLAAPDVAAACREFRNRLPK
jgi:thiamine-phosphate pyrophosphorylase